MNTQTVSLFNKPAGIKHVMYVFRIEIVLRHNDLSSMRPYKKSKGNAVKDNDRRGQADVGVRIPYGPIWARFCLKNH